MYRTIFHACEEGIVVTTRKGNIKLVNPSLAKMFGYDENELVDKPIEVLIPMRVRKSHKVERTEYAKKPSPRKMGVGRELMGLRKDGIEFPVEISLNNAVLDDESFVVAFVIDITERKKIEEALRKSEEQLIDYATQLENRVSQRTIELDRTINKLEEQVAERKKAEKETRKALEKEKELNELKSRFVSMASHEFRTPLSTILSSASLISKYKSTETEEKREKHIEKIKTAIGNLNNILNDFLSLAKLEEGKTDITITEIYPSEIVNEIIGHLETVKRPGQNVEFNCQEELSIQSDGKIFKNILINLLSNAIKYSKENSTIFIGIKYEKDSLILNIKDTGIGIPLSEQEHLFERFFRAKNATNIQGTGLGLNIVKKYVEMLNGSITFESIENEGTTFTVILPR